jgi:putative peptide zinc metalloprotease protein
MTVIGISLFSILKAPATKSSPAIVQFADETVIRANTNGFIEELLVRDGDEVKQGQVLIRLSNPKLANEVVELERLADEALTQSRIFQQQNELAQAMAETRKNEELNKQLAEKSQEANGLNVLAPFDGFVFQRNMGNRLGSFAKRGDPLLTIAHRETKEIVVSIDQRDLESIEGNEGKILRVAMPGLMLFESKLVRVNPRASDIPTHPSLCAQAGGPLPVRPIVGNPDQQEKSRMELISPRFNAFLELDSSTSSRLHAGQRGRAFYSTRGQSLGSYVYLGVRNWLEHKIDLATQSAAF